MKLNNLTIMLLVLICSCTKQTPRIADAMLQQKINVIVSTEGEVVKPEFIPLAPGAIQPKGWIKDWANSALSGITGHLDEWEPTFGESWKGHGFKSSGANKDDGTGFPLEEGSYWLDGAVRLAYIMKDEALIKKVSHHLNYVVDGVLNGGETFVYWKPKTIVEDDFNNWGHSQLGRALVAYYQATGDQRILDALVKVYSDYLLPEYPHNFGGVSGIVNLDPMIDTYLLSGEPKILEAIKKAAGDPKLTELTDEWLNHKIQCGHGVIAYENIRIPAQLYPWSGNEKLLKASLNYFNWIDQEHLLPCGIASSEEHMAGIGSTRNIESCNVAASAWTYQKMYEIDGNASWGDRLEQVFFNAAPAPVDRDFQTMCYYQSMNRIENVVPTARPKHPFGASSYLFRHLGHPIFCCVGNLNRVIPNYVMHMWMATLDKGLAASLYGPSTVRSIVGDGIPVTIESETEYPFNEIIKLRIDVESEVEFPLYLRIPAWCNNPSITVNSQKLASTVNENGFMKILRTWKKGDEVEIDFPMQVYMKSGNETSYPQYGYFLAEGNRELTKQTAVHNPYQTVFYGPLLFAYPLDDMDVNTQVPDQKWNYALNIDGSKLSESVEVICHKMPEKWQWQLDAPVKLKVKAKAFDWHPTELQPLPGDKIKDGENVEIELVPYGCAKFRLTMFPVF